KDIEYLGRVDVEKKREIMQKSHIITVTSVKEGWGLIVTEANSQGTPAIVYNVDGLRDSVKDKKTGIVVEQNTPEVLAQKIILLFQDTETYQKLRKNAQEWSKELTFDKSYEDFVRILEI
ncbi:MAG: glycosyltransferase, partial [Candidatus Moranbacteria bacterium]|nr:glycosyltransferase [Candidatus Moranbacteria bacterium]